MALASAGGAWAWQRWRWITFSVTIRDWKVDQASYEASRSYIVVDTGPWIFGKKELLPAGLIEQLDDVAETVYVDRTKDEIKDAHEFDESRYREEEYRSEVGGYYSRGV